MQNPPNIEVNLAEIDSEKCHYCEHDVFMPGIILKHVSRLLTGGEADQMAQIQTLVCMRCLKPHTRDGIPKP